MDSLELLRALRFAAHHHRDHRRKDPDASPYINHPIEVAETLARHGCAGNTALLQAAILHDTVEDTEATFEDLEAAFGPDVRALVEEVTDDKKLPKSERKRLQVEHAPHLTADARQLKIADKICNVHDVGQAPPEGWSHERRTEYLAWAERVVQGCRGANAGLERRFDEVLARSRALLEREG
jgi:guanosine-3',5'-bis(diphosphate) 3'-pyrophosphohydrolase